MNNFSDYDFEGFNLISRRVRNCETGLEFHKTGIEAGLKIVGLAAPGSREGRLIVCLWWGRPKFLLVLEDILKRNKSRGVVKNSIFMVRLTVRVDPAPPLRSVFCDFLCPFSLT